MDFTAFEATPGISVIVYPDAPKYTHAAVSNDFIGATGMQREDIVGKGHFELFPKSPDDPNFTGEVNLRASFEFIVNHKKPHAIEVQRYDVPNGKGTFTQKYWNIKNAPILSRDGEVLFIVHTAIDITNQVVAEQNAETSKGIEKAYNFFMAAPVIIGYLKGDNYLIELANEGLLEVWAKTPEVIGKPLLEVIPGLEAQGFKDILDNVRNTGEPFYAYELPITLLRHGTEEVLYFDFVYKALFNGDTKTKASGVISVGLDVTEKVLIRNKIKESDEKYRTIFNTMEQGFCIIEMLFDENNKPVDYLFIETNLVFEKQTGLKNAVGKTALQLVPGLENYFVERYAKVAVTGEPIHFIEGSKAMGRWFEVDAFAIGTGGSHRVATLFTDISDRKKAEEDLKQSERNLQFTMDVIPQMVWVTLADGFHDFYNKQWYDYTGLTLEETKGTAWNLVLHPDDQERAWQIWNKCLETGEAYEIEYRLRRFDNCYRWFLGRALPFKDEAGKILKWVGTCTDIHDQKKAAEVMEGLVKERTSELEMTIRELERSNANLEEFAYAASHDLKEPIRKIRTFSERLKSKLKDRLLSEDQYYFERMEKATERMQLLINDLLEYSHVSTEKNTVDDINLNTKVSMVLEDLELEVAEKNATVTVNPLPIVKGNRRQLQQLFQNLITNALKFSKPGVAPAISISARVVNGESINAAVVSEEFKNKPFNVIEVSDNGIGFEQEYAERIFKMFQRLHAKSEYSGTGIGLAIVRKVVENHNGFIKAESKPGEGATFQVFLPVL